MNLMKGNMWDTWPTTDYFIFTGNSFIKRNGALVMGRGIAREVRDKWPGIDVEIGRELMKHIHTDNFYGLVLGEKIGVFQVKHHFSDPAELILIAASAELLRIEAEDHPHARYALNFPGIGNGHLKYDNVLPLLKHLPDNVNIWTFK